MHMFLSTVLTLVLDAQKNLLIGIHLYICFCLETQLF